MFLSVFQAEDFGKSSAPAFRIFLERFKAPGTKFRPIPFHFSILFLVVPSFFKVFQAQILQKYPRRSCGSFWPGLELWRPTFARFRLNFPFFFHEFLCFSPQRRRPQQRRRQRQRLRPRLLRLNDDGDYDVDDGDDCGNLVATTTATATTTTAAAQRRRPLRRWRM